MNYLDCFKGKKITLMGLGLLGRGVGDARFLAQCGAELIVTDLKSAKDLAPSLKKLKKYNITYVLGQHRLEDFQNRDLIIKAAGVPLDSPFITEARKNKIPVAMSTALFVKLSGAKIIGVTGTRGKTTVTQLIYEILRRCQGESLPVARTHLRIGIKKVWLGGNVVGVSTLALLPKVEPDDLVVLELDSWQLQGFASPVGLWPRGALGISPPIAIFTNFMSDHLNYYHVDLDRYFEDKANIYKYQKREDIVFVGREIAGKIKSPGRKIVPPPLPKNWKLNLVGEHNRVNASFAVAVARELGIPDGLIKKAVANFRGIPGRLELVRTLNGVKFYNDTTSTTPEALKVGLEALGGKKPNVILIMGGADKNLDMNIVLKTIRQYCRATILLPGTGTENLKLKSPNLKFREVKNLKEAVELALAVAKRGETILLSPGFASFGPPPGGFKNEYDRGKQFNKLVKKLK